MYFSCPPLYRITVGKDEYHYVQTEQEKEELINKYGNRVANNGIQRFKGLGEMNSEQLWNTTMNPKTRVLEQIVIENIKKDEHMIHLCMGEETAPRKELIMQNSQEANIDV